MVTTTLATLVAAMTLPYQIFYAIYDFDALDVAIYTFSPQVLLYLAVPFMHRFGPNVGAWYLIIVWFIFAHLFTYFFGTESGLQYYFFPGATAGVLVFGGRNLIASVIAMVVGFSGYAIATTYYTEPAPFIEVGPGFLNFMYLLSLPFAFFVVFGIVYFATWQTQRAENALQAEFKRSEDLLYNVLPRSIASKLKANPTETIAQSHPEVSILFADIVDFTPFSSTRPASEVVAFLNAIFSRFDDLARKHGVEKIKTIGDAFMVAGGMPDPQPDHAKRIARMALDMIRETEVFASETGTPLQVRIGVNTGPAVAGVIGNQKLFYDVWGDTVNTAGRMETYGIGQTIQTTRTFREAMKESFNFERRGIENIKGKGEIETWFLLSEKPLVSDHQTGRN